MSAVCTVRCTVNVELANGHAQMLESGNFNGIWWPFRTEVFVEETGQKEKTESFETNTCCYHDTAGVPFHSFEQEQMKQITYKVVTSDDQNLTHESANFDHESEARTYARALAQTGRSAYVLKIDTEFLASYPPETSPETLEDK